MSYISTRIRADVREGSEGFGILSAYQRKRLLELCDACDSYEREADALFEKLEKAAPKWVSVKDALPERHEEVLCVSEVGYICFLWYNPNHKLFNVYEDNVECAIKVTHWMYAPELPQED